MLPQQVAVTKQQILAQYDALLSNMLKQHKAFCDTADAEALHQLRLCYKKLQALLYFFTDDRKKIIATKEFKRLKKFYQRTGEVRDAQMSIKLLKQIDNGVGKTVKKKQRKAEKQTNALLGRSKKDSRIIKEAANSTQNFLSAVPNAALQEKFKVALAGITKQLHPDNRNEDNLHDARKLIKRTGYAGKMLPATLQQKIKLPYTDFKKIEDAIGHWHDSLVLSQYLQTHEGPEEAIQELQKLKKASLQQAEKHIQSFLKKPKQLR